MSPDLIQLAYLVSAVLFVLGIKSLAHPRRAARGNRLGAIGMAVAVFATLLDRQILSYPVIAAGLVVGAVFGTVLALRVQMTGMPQLVALFNGFGGAASLLVGAATLIVSSDTSPNSVDAQLLTASIATVIIGSITVTGSAVAVGKLSEWLNLGRHSPAITTVNMVLATATIASVVGLVFDPTQHLWLIMMVGATALLGIGLVLPIGGADMPVVIALLNSLSGLAAAGAGFSLDNPLLIIAGSLVGASGLILTQIMCTAMNRTLLGVLFTAVTAGEGADPNDVYEGRVTSTSADEVAMLLDGTQRVAFIPGYGMAVAQAQHAVRDLARQLEARGTEVVFAIHPVAGRMPGHMNVLLAEAEVPYEQLLDMNQANPTFRQTDVVVIIGANDVVNPAARDDPNSPIAGMPILDADQAQTVIVIKRSLSPGFAGIPNPLFAADNTLMLFADGQNALVEINRALSEV